MAGTDNLKRFSPKQIKNATSKFSNILGSGSCGDVYLGKYDGQLVAVKVLKQEVLADNIKDQFLAEVSTLGKNHHRNLVKLYGFCFHPKMIALVYEYMEMGSLDKFLNGKSSIKWKTMCNIAIGTAKGISYLHEDCQPSIIHYDIKPSNILLNAKFTPKIGDFGLDKLLKMDASHDSLSNIRGTPYYCAPELHLPYLKINYKCDVYSYGMMLFDIVSMRTHQSQEAEEWFPREVYDKYQKGTLEGVMADYIEAKDRDMAKRILMIALSCVEFWAPKRPTMKEVIRLLKGTKDPLMSPNHFLASLYMVPSSVAPNSRKGDELRGGHGRRKNNSHEKEKDQSSREVPIYPPAEQMQEKDQSSREVPIYPPAKGMQEKDQGLKEVPIYPPAKRMQEKDQSSREVPIYPPAKRMQEKDQSSREVPIYPPAKQMQGKDQSSREVPIYPPAKRMQEKDQSSREVPIYPPDAKRMQEMFREHSVEDVSEEVRPQQEYVSKPNLNKKDSHFPLFLLTLILILFIKFHLVWLKKLGFAP